MAVAITSMFAGLFTCLIPQCTTFPAMLVVHALVTVCTGAYENTVCVEEVQAWDGSSESALQFLSFCFSIGGMISPLITRPFLAPKVAHVDTDNNSSVPSPTDMSYSSPGGMLLLPRNDTLDVSSNVLCPETTPNCSCLLVSQQECNVSSQGPILSNQTLQSGEVTSNLQYAYLITGSANILLSFAFCALCVHSIYKKRPETRKEKRPLPAKRKVPKLTTIRLVALNSAFYFFHAMGTDSIAQYLFYFTVTHLNWSKKNGAYLMSLFWALGIPVKLLLVVIYRKIRVGTVLLLSTSGIVVFVVLFVLAGQFHLHFLVWISCSGVAISQAAIYGGGLSWTDGNLIQLDGKVTSVLMIFASIGALLAPLPLGYLMKNWSLMSFPFCVLAQVSCSASLFMVMLCVVKPAMDRKYGPVRPNFEHEVVPNGEALEQIIPSEDDNNIGNNKPERIEFM